MITSIATTTLVTLALLAVLAASLIPLGVHLGFRAPRVPATRSPAALGLAFETVRILTVRGRTLTGWLLPAADATRTVIILHGWGSNAEQMLPLAQPLHQAEFNVLLFDARNHGASDGDSFSSLPRFAEDLGAAITWLRQQHPSCSTRIAVLGHSVGAGAALFEATRNPHINAVISIGAFADPAQLTERYLARLHLPRFVVELTKRYVEWVIGYRFATIAPVNSIRRVPCPVLLVHGDHDQTVPIEDAKRLAAAADPARVRLFVVAGAGHDSVDKIEAHADALLTFLGAAWWAT
ncbi:alpha/beta hydrolase [Halochromatium salexigens]|uniref:Alpha/beta hydrolase n=1 Tax=Halochromatium salexigens TaxID=49447 RepID=A0AAJ0XGR9_HALSE|nr:alpha/beta fold hydrolase [Halochromatium salexigens]MBK5931843.1 alpha/beta hydrolase [Halochromatium salexigens]